MVTKNNPGIFGLLGTLLILNVVGSIVRATDDLGRPIRRKRKRR